MRAPEIVAPALPRLVAFAGRAGAGKSTAARGLVEAHAYTLTRFAGPLKAMMAALGLTPAEIAGEAKELPCARLGGVSPRRAMQTLGTEWGRDMIHNDLWVDIWRQDAAAIFAAGGRVVVDDCRFANEAAAVRSLGGVIVEIRSPYGPMIGAGHASEAQAARADSSIINERCDLDVLNARVLGALDGIGAQLAAR